MILTVYCCILNVIAKTLQYTINNVTDSNFTNSPPYQIEGKEIKDASKLLAGIFSSNREIYGVFQTLRFVLVKVSNLSIKMFVPVKS